MSRELVLSAVLVASCVSFVTIPLSGHISDRIGRRKMYLIGAAATGVFGFVYFAMLGSASPVLIFAAIVLSLIPHDMMYGPQAALIAEAFTPRLRYSGASLGYQLGIGYCRWSGAIDCDGIVRNLSYGLRRRDLYCRLRGDQPDCGCFDAGLYRKDISVEYDDAYAVCTFTRQEIVHGINRASDLSTKIEGLVVANTLLFKPISICSKCGNAVTMA